MSSCIPTKDLEIVYEEDWSDFVKVDFDVSPLKIDVKNGEDNDEIELKIRKDISFEQDNDIVKLNENDKANNMEE